jgi:dTDP-4-dehydrorhamnose reductase
MKRLLILGSRGFLGAHLLEAARTSWEICDDQGIDITDSGTLRDAFQRLRPDAVVLLAAISDIDRCQRERMLATRVNLFGAAAVAAECAQREIRLLFTSTAAVFSGTKHGYAEGDPPDPASYYGETKAKAEAAIRGTVPAAVIVRIALALGFAKRPGTNSLLDKLAESFQAGRTVATPVDEFRNPIDAGTLSRAMLALLDSPVAAGIYHAGASDSISRFDLAKKVAVRLGYPERLVEPQRDSPPGRAPRGRDHFLLTSLLREATGIAAPSCDEVLGRCFDGTA